jgi:hypothetical protein
VTIAVSRFVKGLAVGLVGAVLIAVAWFAEAPRQQPAIDPDELSVLLANIGLVLAVGGPLFFWVIVPLITWIRRRETR